MPPLMLSGLPWPKRPLRILAPSPCFAYTEFRSLGIAGATPVAEYILFLSGIRELLVWAAGAIPSTFELRTLRGRLSRLPPQSDDGARARTEASVSMERRRRRLLDEASVKMEALSVKRLLAVAVEYVVGFPAGARCAGMAEAGEAVGKG